MVLGKTGQCRQKPSRRPPKTARIPAKTCSPRLAGPPGHGQVAACYLA